MPPPKILGQKAKNNQYDDSTESPVKQTIYFDSFFFSIL